MTGEFGSFRFGWDGVNRISGATTMLQEATEMLPAEIRHNQVPFLPTIVDGSGTSSDTQLSVDGHPLWFAQVRRWHSYKSTLIDTFSVKASFHTGTTEADEYTIVELFLPRTDNTEWGVFQWELYSISTEDYTRFPKPDDVDAADWPPPDALRTWLWGHCTIVPRTATTDYLPTPPTTPGTPVLTQGGVFFAGPNGRVP